MLAVAAGVGVVFSIASDDDDDGGEGGEAAVKGMAREGRKMRSQSTTTTQCLWRAHVTASFMHWSRSHVRCTTLRRQGAK
jgi:hypothetical protein